MVIDILRGERLRLTAPRPEDSAYWTEVFEDGAYLRLVDSGTAWPQAGMAPSGGSPTSFPFSLRTLDDGRLIGFGAIHSIEWNNRAGFLAMGIGRPQDRRQGYGSEAIGLLLRYGFWELNLHRIGLDVNSYNEPAIRLYEKAGFVREGVLRQALWRDGQPFDRIMMGMLKEEWEARRP